MEVNPLTIDEARWVKKFQALMKKCPSNRLGAFTTGDPEITLYDKTVLSTYLDSNRRDERDEVVIHHELGTMLASINMPFKVDTLCG